MQIGIVGGGSIGLLLAAYLCKAEFKVLIYTRSEEQAKELKRNGILLERENGIAEKFHVDAIAFSKVEKINDEVLFIALKQYVLPQFISAFLEKNENVQSIVFLQNGMSHVKLMERLTHNLKNIFIGIVEHGALKRSSTVVAHTGLGELKIGCFQQHDKFDSRLWEALSKVGFNSAAYENWQEIIEKKLIVNCVINPLTAIYKVRNGSLISNRYYFQQMRKVFEEISLVFNCNEQDWKEIIKICKKTAKNYSSMLKDIQSSRKTEIDAITGILLDRAKEHNIMLPVNLFLYHSVKGMEDEQKGEVYE